MLTSSLAAPSSFLADGSASSSARTFTCEAVSFGGISSNDIKSSVSALRVSCESATGTALSGCDRMNSAGAASADGVVLEGLSPCLEYSLNSAQYLTLCQINPQQVRATLHEEPRPIVFDRFEIDLDVSSRHRDVIGFLTGVA